MELFTAGAGMEEAGVGDGGATRREGPVKRSSAPTGAGAGVGAGADGILRACGSGRGGSALTWIFRNRSVKVE